LPEAGPKSGESLTCVPSVRVWNQTRFGCVGSTRNRWYCAFRSNVSSSLKPLSAARYSSFGKGPMTGAQNSKPSAMHAPSSLVPMPSVNTSFVRTMSASGVIGKFDFMKAAASSTQFAANAASRPLRTAGEAFAAAISAGVVVAGFVAAGAATAASSFGCADIDSRYDEVSAEDPGLFMVAVLCGTVLDIDARYEFSNAVAPHASTTNSRIMFIDSGRALLTAKLSGCTRSFAAG